MNGRRVRVVAASLALLLGPVAASVAATVYRCGNVYTDVPCPRAATIEVDDSRSEADRAAAREVASREAALAARMEADRQRTATPAPALRTARAKRPAVAASTPKMLARERSRRLALWRDENLFIAVVPGNRQGSAKP